MKLDKRVKENALIGHYFNAEVLKQYIGKECYFTDSLEDFSDLTDSLKGVLKAVGPDAEECYLVESEINGQPADLHYTFCLPAEFVEEKKYRPYTIKEFSDKFTVGFPIKFRQKGAVGYERYLILAGYWPEQRNGQILTHIYIGANPYTLDELFNAYEWQEHCTEDFKPFGVEETE